GTLTSPPPSFGRWLPPSIPFRAGLRRNRRPLPGRPATAVALRLRPHGPPTADSPVPMPEIPRTAGGRSDRPTACLRKDGAPQPESAGTTRSAHPLAASFGYGENSRHSPRRDAV